MTTTNEFPVPSEAWIKGWNARIDSMYDAAPGTYTPEQKDEFKRGYRAASKEIAKRGAQL